MTRISEEIDTTQTRLTEYAYDANRNLIRETFGGATSGAQPDNRVDDLYDSRDLLFQKSRDGSTPSTTQYDYDGNRNLIRETAGLEHEQPRVSTNLYDGYNRRVAAIDPMGNRTLFNDNANHNRTALEVLGEALDGTGDVANRTLYEQSFTFDALDRLTADDTMFWIMSSKRKTPTAASRRRSTTSITAACVVIFRRARVFPIKRGLSCSLTTGWGGWSKAKTMWPW